MQGPGEDVSLLREARLTDADDGPVSARDDESEIDWCMSTPPEGLSTEEASARAKQYGPNMLSEKKRNELLVFLSYFSGPMPIMIWVATLVVALEGDWDDFSVLLTLQVINGVVGYYEERSAGDAIEALKASLAPRCNTKRDNKFTILAAKMLVPGDLINIKLGDIVPADCKLKEGKPLEVDQSALTGESLPVTMGTGDMLKMGSIIKRGEIEAIVCFTGRRTFFGRAADMVNKAAEDAQGRFAKIMFRNTMVLFVLSFSCCAVILFKLLQEGIAFLEALSTVVVILVASIPIAMQIVSTTVMAVGGRFLAQKKAIVARLSAIEELAGMTVLCSDKTGTLTQNKLQLFDPTIFDPAIRGRPDELVWLASLAAKRIADGADAIDTVITAALPDAYRARFDTGYEELDFTPFDPVLKRTEATVRSPEGIIKVSKGATKVVLALCQDARAIEEKVMAVNDELASRGFRSLGVAATRPGTEKWEFKGVLSLFDPPRVDTKDTIIKAQSMGIAVKMVTGDQTAIAKETARVLEMGSKILDMKDFTDAEAQSLESAMTMVRESDGFAEVYPEHKYRIVELLQAQDLTVGMTGDGVNDAPALKKAQIGIAVEGATDAARAAADIVLTAPGLSVIIDAILTSRCIFARVRNYVIYRIACTLQLVCFFFFACLTFRPKQYYCWESTANVKISGSVFASCDYDAEYPDSGHDYDGSNASYPYFYPDAKFSFCIPVLGIVVITILNDGCMLTIARDHVVPAATPQDWYLNELRLVALFLGAIPLASSLLLLWLGLTCADGLYPSYAILLGRKVPAAFGDHYYLPYPELIMLMYLKISISDFLTLFSARTRGPFWERLPSTPLFLAFLVATVVASIIASCADIPDSDYPMQAISARATASVWLYNLAFFLIQDFAKVTVYKAIERFNPFGSMENFKTAEGAARPLGGGVKSV